MLCHEKFRRFLELVQASNSVTVKVESTERLRRLETTRGTVDMKTFHLSTGSELSGQKDAVQISQTIGTWPAEAWMNKSRTEMDGAGSILKNPTAQLNALDLGFAKFC